MYTCIVEQLNNLYNLTEFTMIWSVDKGKCKWIHNGNRESKYMEVLRHIPYPNCNCNLNASNIKNVIKNYSYRPFVDHFCENALRSPFGIRYVNINLRICEIIEKKKRKNRKSFVRRYEIKVKMNDGSLMTNSRHITECGWSRERFVRNSVHVANTSTIFAVTTVYGLRGTGEKT